MNIMTEALIKSGVVSPQEYQAFLARRRLGPFYLIPVNRLGKTQAWLTWFTHDQGRLKGACVCCGRRREALVKGINLKPWARSTGDQNLVKFVRRLGRTMICGPCAKHVH